MKVICYTHSAAIEKLFNDQDSTIINQTKQSVNHAVWLELSTVEHLLSYKTFYCALDSILKNESTISNTYEIINTVFEKQLECDYEKVFDSQLYLIYDDQKTVSLIHNVQKKWQKATLQYDQYNWFLSVLKLFHWQINYMNMIHDTYSESEHAVMKFTFYHNKNYFDCVQSHNSSFHHKKKMMM